uniref:Uncharacterized protein n=1 Tax=viral metagenome TaxID=1070528 RepID=A0A6C0EHC1_9ZZZZ
MSSILLNPLYFSSTGNNINSYNSNMKEQINNIEMNQIKNLKNNAEYLNQFDDLKFDNTKNPVCINETNTTYKGFNTTLERNLDFKNGYSNIQNKNMHYDVIEENDFYHNNMIPNSTKRDLSQRFSTDQRTLELFTGVSSNYTPKTEKQPLFEPMRDLTWVNGMPVVGSDLQNRYLPSNKNNHGNLPFDTNIRIIPGIENQIQSGNNSVYRVNPLNVDQLRSEINQKITYLNKPLETIKLGEIRAQDPIITKYKLPDFKETKFDDLMASRALFEGPMMIGEFVDIDTQRNEKQNYCPGPAINTNLGDGPDKTKTKFADSKKENYMNDPSHSITAVYDKPIINNKKAYASYENQRDFTNYENTGNINSTMNNNNNYTINYEDIPLVTLRQLTIDNNYISNTNIQEKNNYIFSNDMVLPVTNRQTIQNNEIIGIHSEVKKSNIQNNDIARSTHRPDTTHNLAINSVTQDRNVPIYNNNKAKDTHRPSTSHNIAINTITQDRNAPVYNEDRAKATIRPEVSHNLILNSITQDRNVPVYNHDKAKTTIRPEVSHNLVMNSITQDRNVPIYNEDKAKTTQRPEISHNLVMNSITQDRNVPVHNQDRAKTTQRPEISHNLVMNSITQDRNVPIYNNDKAKTTIRPEISHNLVMNSITQDRNVPIYNEDKAKLTIKQTTLYNTPEVNLSDNYKSSIYNNLQDEMKKTMKETTLFDNGKSNNITNCISNYVIDKNYDAKTTNRQTISDILLEGTITDNNINSTYIRDLLDKTRVTTKELTENNQYISNINNSNDTITYTRDINDRTRTTIRQQIENTNYLSNVNNTNENIYIKDNNYNSKPTIKQTTLQATPGGRLNNTNFGNITELNDKPKITNKESTILENYLGGIKGIIEGDISHDSSNNMTINERREISTFNRPANGKADFNGPYINKETVVLREPILFSYVSHPHKNLDQSIMPSCKSVTSDNIYNDMKNPDEYYINKNYINTLEDNPYVNDIFHQKNY